MYFSVFNMSSKIENIVSIKKKTVYESYDLHHISLAQMRKPDKRGGE